LLINTEVTPSPSVQIRLIGGHDHMDEGPLVDLLTHRLPGKRIPWTRKNDHIHIIRSDFGRNKAAINQQTCYACRPGPLDEIE